MRRRDVLRAGAAGLLPAGLFTAGSLPARAAAPDRELRFVFVVAQGGWDVTRVFAPLFGNPLVDMEPEASEARIGSLPVVDHPARPSVRAFFERWWQQSLILNGISVPSVGHEECLRLLLTGDGTGVQPDWAALIAAEDSDRWALPTVTIRGPDYPGSLGMLRTRIGAAGQVGALLDGSLMAAGDGVLPLPGAAAQAEADRWLRQRMLAREAALTGSGAARDRAEQARIALERAQTLESLAGAVAWGVDSGLLSQADLAVDLLARGMSRSIVMQHGEHTGWDSHSGNDYYQSLNFEDLFAGLIYLQDRLERTPGWFMPTLAEEVVVVVLSEMGRTPKINGGDGKDHWGYTSMLLSGPGINGGRAIGDYSGYFYGERVDPPSGVITAGGRLMTGGDVGVTLLSMAGAEIPAHLSDQVILDSILSA